MTPFLMESLATVSVINMIPSTPVAYVLMRCASKFGVGPRARSSFALESIECVYARPSNASSASMVQYISLVESSKGNIACLLKSRFRIPKPHARSNRNAAACSGIVHVNIFPPTARSTTESIHVSLNVISCIRTSTPRAARLDELSAPHSFSNARSASSHARANACIVFARTFSSLVVRIVSNISTDASIQRVSLSRPSSKRRVSSRARARRRATSASSSVSAAASLARARPPGTPPKPIGTPVRRAQPRGGIRTPRPPPSSSSSSSRGAIARAPMPRRRRR